MISKIAPIIAIYFISFLSTQIYGSERLYRNPYYYGQGHAGSADDSTLDNFYYDPALLYRENNNETCEKNANKEEKPIKYLFILPTLEISKSTYSVLKAKKEEDRLKFIKNNIGNPLYARNSQLAILNFSNYSFSLLQDIQAQGLASHDLANKGIETIDLSLIKTLALSVNGNYHRPHWSFGINTHLINRENAHINSEITDITTIKNLKNIKNTKASNGIGADIGAKYRINDDRLVVGVSVINIGDTSFKKEIFKRDYSHSIEQSIDIGLKYTLPDWYFANNLYLDIRDIENKQKESFFTHIHFGHEARILSQMKFSWGFNQGYFSFGIKANYKNSHLLLGRYSEETGETAGFRQDERYFIQMRFAN